MLERLSFGNRLFCTYIYRQKNIIMKFKVSGRTLLLIAGLVWIIAGANILRIGIVTWLTDSQSWLFKVCESTAVFLLFFNLVFRKLFNKHSKRIEEKRNKHSPFSFFDVKGWILMAFMITLGIVIRGYHLLPNSFISVFYTGLSSALIITGFLFLRRWWARYGAR